MLVLVSVGTAETVAARTPAPCGGPPQPDGVKFVKGWFRDTTPPFTRDSQLKNRLVVHIDCDLYGGAMLALVHLAMSKGTILIFDEFFDRDNAP